MSNIVKIGNVAIGGGNPVAIQSMTNTHTADREATLRQILALEQAGCQIVRFTVNTPEAAESIPYLLKHTHIPLVADIHFDYRLALKAAEYGIHKIRINPGNIGSADRIREVARVCNQKNIPVRIGINGGSLEKELLAKYGSPTPEALCESALKAAREFEEAGLSNLVLSVKSSSVPNMIGANRLLAQQCDYPLHLGVTETGTKRGGTVKSAVGIGALLCDGIGDTMRVSLTADPVEQFSGLPRNENTACVCTSRLLVIEPDAELPSVMKIIDSSARSFLSVR
ncbi:MAG: (E)-4-hydroxy-3-methylbut-2-enyl-diphosphate synthase, partial [Clostridia bacterium]|nr:(E)-4-hydroxy-3-methylbut-2-enyl-diphosphate synthase [Clostridia bacterium]